ncbi:hypothetical protein CEXT_736601 [Caerostris extrusa]|uniref:Uncharacterized protein n=1 Tax=Caerostris extrusa TaxID=172846 RepID=A0AAV4V0W5_CAEEX|nr:hypothetical protein CEXT_736601 [Caerostris extrusa]
MDENLRQARKHFVEMTEEIENNFLLASNVFNRIEQGVYVYTSLDPKTLTSDECHARVKDSTILINRLQELRKEIENIMNIYEKIVCDVRNQNHPNLLHRLERDIKCKIRDLLKNVLYIEFLVDCYKIKLESRQNMLNFSRNE